MHFPWAVWPLMFWEHGSHRLCTLCHFLFGNCLFRKIHHSGEKNPHWMGYAKTYHWFMLLVPALFGHPWLFIPYLFSLVRLYRWGGAKIKPVKLE